MSVTISDIQAGNAANMRTILAAYGYIPLEDQADLGSWGADNIIHSVAGIDRFVWRLDGCLSDT